MHPENRIYWMRSDFYGTSLKAEEGFKKQYEPEAAFQNYDALLLDLKLKLKLKPTLQKME